LKQFVSIFTVCFLLLTASSLRAEDQPHYKVYLTKKVENDQPLMEDKAETTFDCTDRIYLVVEALGLTSESYKLTVKWLNPVNKQQEKTGYTFDAFPFTRIWAWLQLSGPPGAVIGQVFDPTFGMEEFIGDWNAVVSIDKKKIKSAKFTVVC
jgi:hypothetical protein